MEKGLTTAVQKKLYIFVRDEFFFPPNSCWFITVRWILGNMKKSRRATVKKGSRFCSNISHNINSFKNDFSFFFFRRSEKMRIHEKKKWSEIFNRGSQIERRKVAASTSDRWKYIFHSNLSLMALFFCWPYFCCWCAFTIYMKLNVTVFMVIIWCAINRAACKSHRKVTALKTMSFWLNN